jgi:C-terminal processing protease CtpA/Prc
VGYVALLRFDRTGEREFVDAMASFRARGVRALVVDLRYNPGGRLYSAAQIAGAIVGERGRGEVFATTHHNSRYRDRDGVLRFQVPAGGGLGAEQLVVITSDASCSASELLVKGLEPYLPVATVGTTTCGKPVGSTAVESGSWRYSVISFAVRNARGEGEYFEGLAPTCVATDDLARELGDTAEASLREALHYLETGRCSGPA